MNIFRVWKLSYKVFENDIQKFTNNVKLQLLVIKIIDILRIEKYNMLLFGEFY